MKRILMVFVLLLCSRSLFSQTLYVKLKKPLEQSQSLVEKVNQRFAVSFVKHEKMSALINAPVYKIQHSLTNTNAKQLHQLLSEDNAVVYSSLMMEPPMPPNDIPPVTPNYISNQGYLDTDPGIDAEYAWTQGADGSNIDIHLLEYGLNLNHEEFVGRNNKILDGMSISQDAVDLGYTEHGTATSGVVFGGDNGYGVKGIAYNANSLTLYPEWQEGQDWDRVQAVSNAVDAGSAGDIMIYEMQTWGPIDSLFVPAEYDPLIWDLTKIATNKGIVVVAAAGNGGVNLDVEAFDEYHSRGDSGAIIVGASWPDIYHSTIGGNYGNRVDVNAWGIFVFTSGNGDIQIGNDFNQGYNSNFGGTSSATAISGGCVTALQSYYHTISGGEYLTSTQMRDLLIESGISQPVSETNPTGKFINMRAAIERLNVLSNDDESFGDRLIVYPNPTNGLVTVKNEQLTSGQLEVFDSLGKQLISQTISDEETKLDLSDLSQGVYFVKIVSGSKSGIKRIVKN